jgi:hypothetical protein
MKLGAQLYTLREYCQTIEDFAETLKRVADIGYTTVQVSGTCDYEPEWLRDRLKETGLKCVLTHTKADKILADPAALCDAHKIFDCRNIGLGGLGKGFTDEKYAQFVSDFKSATETIVANGCKFFFHNHCEEFKRGADGKTYIGSTHNVPHTPYHLKDNNFDGHLCVHFPIPMEKAKEIGPYATSHQETINEAWGKLLAKYR